MPNVDHDTIELVFVAIAAAALVLQTAFVVALFFALRKAARATRDEIQDIRSSVMPLVYNTRDVFARVAPKFEEAADELAALAHSLRLQTTEVQAAASEVIDRGQRIAARVDSMATSVLDGVERAAEFVTHTVAKPVRQFSGALASIKAILESLRASEYSSRSRPMGRNPAVRRSNDKDMSA